MDILNELIMLLDTELSAIKLKLVAMDDSNPEYDILTILEANTAQQVEWHKLLLEKINDGVI